MSILLPPEQLAEWFPHQLVVLTEEASVQGMKGPVEERTTPPQELAPNAPALAAAAQGPAAPTSPLPFLGKNQKNILVLVRATGVNHLPDAHLDFLVTVLQACQLGLADIALVNLAAQERDWAQLVDQCQPKTALLFGVDPAPLGLPFVVPPYRPYAHGSIQFLLLPQLTVYLQADAAQAKTEKKLLWNALKTIFPPHA